MSKRTVMHDTFVIEREFTAPPERIFAYFSDPARKRRWLGGEDDGFEIESFEPAFGVDQYERWQYRFKGGELIRQDVCYQDIVPNSRVVFVYTMMFGQKRVSTSQTTVEFIPTPKGTLLIHTEQGAFFDGIDQAKGREEGTRGVIEKLAQELQKQD